MGVASHPVTKMVLGRKLLFIFCSFVVAQGSPSPLWHTSQYGFEDVNAEAIVVEVIESQRSGRQLVENPMAYQGFSGFQPGIMGWPGQSARTTSSWTPDNSPWSPSSTKSPWESSTTTKNPWWNPSPTTPSPWTSSTTTKNPWWNPSPKTTYPPWSSSTTTAASPWTSSTTTKNPWWTPSTTTASRWTSST